MMIQITTSLGTYRMDVVQAEFVRKCPHCDREFLTPNIDKRFPTKSHMQMYWQKRHRKLKSDETQPRPLARQLFYSGTA